MASKTVQPIDIKLGIKGGEQLGKLSSAFRDLAKTVGQTDAGLEEARRSIIEYGRTANQSEALIQGQIKAFEGLRKQAEIGGKVFTQLGSDIDALKGVLRGASTATEAQRQALVNIGSTANATTAQIQGAINSLIRLRGETRPNSEAFNSLGESIERLTSRLNEVTRETEELALAQQTLNQSVSASAGGAQRQIQSIDAVTRSLRQQRDELGALGNDSELVQRRQREGLASLIERGVQPSGRRSFEDVYAKSLLSFGEVPIESMVPVKDLRLIEEEVKRVLQDLQEQIETSLTQGIKRSFQETARAGRESARAMAAAFADPEMLGILERLNQRIGELPNTTAGFNQRLRELQQQLANTARDSEAYVLVSLEIARVQREATAATQGLGAALVNDLASGVAVRSQRNLREAIGQLRTEMADLNTTTTEGSALYAQKAAQANRLQKELDQIANSYRTVGEAARQANAAMGSGINPFGAAGGRNPAYSRAQERQEMEEIARLQDELAIAEGEYAVSIRSALQTMQEFEDKNHKRFMAQVAAEDAAQEQAFKNQQAREQELFQAELERADRAKQRAVSVKGMLGLSGEELSPFYQGVVGIASSRQKGVQARMGKTPQQALADIVSVFNSDLRRTGSGFLDAEQKIREAAIDFSGGSRKVRERFEEIPIGKTPTAMYPQAEESPAQYRQRIEGAQRSLIDRIRSFGKKLDESGDGFLKAEKDLRKAAIDFAGGSEEVKSAFKRFSLGKTPMQLFPAGGETPEAYVERIRGGFTQFDIPDFSSFRKGTTRELQLVRDSLSELRLDLDPLAAGFETMEKKAVSSIQRIDRELERRQSRGARRRMSPMQMTQAAGAAISGGIFGGPEGFLGGVIGSVGGVGGAFAGAAIGAQVAGVRKQIGAMTDYAAQIQKMQIPLKELAGSQEEYNKAIQAASFATERLNVPQDLAIASMTKLLAAVKGAGGGVNDAQLAFLNFTAAIKAAGGSAEQIEGAMTALVQIFSKGKVSAEEINQIAERLPGTFNLFAQAAGKTGPELAKALEEGSVGLNDLMSLVVMLGETNLETALKIASSSEEAGARLQVAYMEASKDIGKEFQALGARFQDSFAAFVVENKDTIATWARITASSVNRVIDTLLVLGGIASRSIKGIVAFAQSLRDQIEASIKRITDTWDTATSTIASAFSSAAESIGIDLKGLSRFARGVASFFQDVFGKAFDFVKDKWAETVKNIITLSNPIGWIGKLLGVDIGEAAVTALQAALSAAGKKAGVEVPEMPEPNTFPGPKIEGKADKGGAKAARDADRRAEEIAGLKRALALGEARARVLQIEEKIKAANLAITDAQNQNNFAALRQIEDLARALEDERKRTEIVIEYNAKMREIRETSQGEIRDLREKLAFQEKNLALQRAEIDFNAQNLAAQQELTRLKKEQSKSFEQQFTDRQRELGLISEPQYNEILMARERERLAGIEGLTPEQRQRGLDLYRQEIDPTPFESMRQNITQLKDELRELVDPINQITGAATAIGDAFSQSFVDAISGSKTAKEALADFFSSVGSYFLDMAKQIIAKMIQIAILNSVAKLLPSTSLTTSTGVSMSAGTATQSGFDMGSSLAGMFKANGGPVNANQPYIVGERGPELFVPFQQGNITSNEELEAQMRETGSAPMAFAKAGADGKNGDDTISTSERRLLERSYADMLRETREERSYADMLRETREERSYADRLRETESSAKSIESMERSYADRLRETREIMLPFTRNSEQASMIAAERETAQAISNPGPIDVRYESQVINGVEYITAEQHRKGMAQAAERGRALTLQALQNSVKTRSRVGI